MEECSPRLPCVLHIYHVQPYHIISSFLPQVFVVYICTVGTGFIIFAQVLISTDHHDHHDQHHLRLYVSTSAPVYASTLSPRSPSVGESDSPVPSTSGTLPAYSDTLDPYRRRSQSMLLNVNPISLAGKDHQLSMTPHTPPTRHQYATSDIMDREAYVDLHEVGSTFSHNGSSWFLRIGIIGNGLKLLVLTWVHGKDQTITMARNMV